MLPSAFTQSATHAHFRKRQPYFVFQYQLLEGWLTWSLEMLEQEVWSGLEGLETRGGISYHSHQKCLVGSHSFGLGKINQTTHTPLLPPQMTVRQITTDQGGPFSPPVYLYCPTVFLFPAPLSGFIGEETETQKASVWEATCYLRVLGMEATAEASLSAVMKAGRFGQFRSQHSSTPFPQLRAGTAYMTLIFSFLFPLPSVPHLDLCFPLRERVTH